MKFKYKANENNFKVLGMKGISPVIATILLVGITVGVIIIVNIWFPSLIGSQTETIESSSQQFTRCASTTIDLVEVRYPASGSPKLINVTISTSGSQNLKNVTVSIAGGGASVTSIKYYNATGDDLVPGVSFSAAVNATNTTLPPELVTVSATCQGAFVLSDSCSAGQTCMKPSS